MRLRLVILLAAATSLVACTQATQPTPKTDDEKALYSLGVLMSQNVKSFDFTDQELAMVKAGLADGIHGKEIMKTDEMEAFLPKLQELQTKRMAESVTKEKEAGAAYLAKAAKEKGAETSPSGLVFKTVTEGSGATPKPSDTVKVNYEGRFIDGKVFDSSIERKEPIEFPLDGVIQCWTEGVQKMKVGGKAQFVCPPDLAYGDEGHPPQMKGGATLVFDVELLDIVPPGSAPAPAPAK
jgi:FKBP-type peptidyl-prolyl cis-trans isomerase